MGDSAVCPSAATNLRNLTYSLAGPVSGGGPGGGCWDARSKYQKPARPTTATRTMTSIIGGMASGFFVRGAALLSANGHFSHLDCRRGDGAAKLQVRSEEHTSELQSRPH